MAHEIPRTRALAPEKKVTAAGGSGLVALVVVWVAAQLGLDMPELVGQGVVYLAMLAAAYLTPHTRRRDLGEET